MKRFQHIDVIFILALCVLLFGFVSLRFFTKEILIDCFGISVPGSKYILYDLNTTIEFPGKPKEETEQQSRYSALIERLQYKLEAYTTSAMIFNQQINKLVGKLDQRMLNIPTTYSNLRFISTPYENVREFATILEEKEIPFLYVSTPCRDSVLSRMGEKEMYENELAERSWLLLQNLREAGVPTLDLAEDLAAAGLTNYDVTNHWFPESALYSAKVIAETLNGYGFSFHPEQFESDNTWDFLGDNPALTDAIETQFGYHYSLPVPNAADGLTFTLSHEGAEYTGVFEEVYLRMPEEVNGNAYHKCSRVSNSTLYQFHNPGCEDNAGKKLLIIGDSFNWLLSSYLSVDIEWIDVIHNASFGTSILQHIEETDPDMVLIIYNDAEFVEVYTEAAFRFD